MEGGMHRSAGAAEGKGRGEPQAVEQSPGWKCCPEQPTLSPAWDLLFCSPECTLR